MTAPARRPAPKDRAEPPHRRRELLTLRLMRRSRQSIGPAAGLLAALLLVLLLQGNGFVSTLVVDMLVYAIVAMALDFLGGYAGLISLGQAGFLGVGAYGVAIAEVHVFSPWAAVGIALAVVLALGLALGIVAVRVKGVSFVIITLAIGQIMWGLSYQWIGLTGGDNGITGDHDAVDRLVQPIGPAHLPDDRLVVFVLVLC